MEENENKVNEEVKKRGRPKKSVKPSVKEDIKEEVEPEVEDIPEVEEEKYIDYTAPVKKVPFADEDPYPNAAEEALSEDRREDHPDVRIPDNKQDDTFFRKLFKKNKMKKDGKVMLVLLHPNTDATISYIDTEKDGSFKVQDETYHVNEHCIYSLKHKRDRFPMCILPTWSMVPIGNRTWFELSQERRGHELERIILNAIKKEEVLKDDEKKKKGLGGGKLWIIIGVIIVGYFILKSGAIKF